MTLYRRAIVSTESVTDERPEPREPSGDMVDLAVTLPLDDDFLRRECSSCERQFKRLGSRSQVDPQPVELFCPYCYLPAGADSWWTPAQLVYLQEVAAAQVVGPQLDQLRRSMNDAPTGLVQLSIEVRTIQPPRPLQESSDMTRVVMPCHVEEPLKVVEAWSLDIGCHMCGQRYAPGLIVA